MSFDLALFEELDASYADRPIKPTPVPRDPASHRAKALGRIASMSKDLGLSFAGNEVLELGCGHGWQSLMLAEKAAVTRVVGVDIRRYPTWDEIDHPDVDLVEVDMTITSVVPESSIDIVVSGAVLEHVHRPLATLEAVYTCLRPGGRAWLYLNLYRGPQASHRYNDVRFPWPHLLFSDEVCEAWFEKHRGRRRTKFAWVNRLTLAEYLAVVDEIGFTFIDVRRRVTPIDISFYLRFEDILGRYPALDLETDFATLVVEKPDGEEIKPAPRLPYLSRQRALQGTLKVEPEAYREV